MEWRDIILPGKREIIRRLRTVTGIERCWADRFYPLIAKAAAGRKFSPASIAEMLVDRIGDFISSGYPPIVFDILFGAVPSFIEALVDDRELAEEAKNIFQRAKDGVFSRTEIPQPA